MSSKHKRRHRGVNATGRSTGQARFVKLDYYLLDSEAYRSLKALPRAVYTLLRRRFNGRNNGTITCSIRDVARECRCSKDAAKAAFDELQAKGFIKCAQRGSFHYKKRHAPEWILSEESYLSENPTKEFMRWRQRKKGGPETGTNGPEAGPDVPKQGPNDVGAVLQSGPKAPIEPSSRS